MAWTGTVVGIKSRHLVVRIFQSRPGLDINGRTLRPSADSALEGHAGRGESSLLVRARLSNIGRAVHGGEVGAPRGDPGAFQAFLQGCEEANETRRCEVREEGVVEQFLEDQPRGSG